jgi:hypothetical protein
MMKGVVRNMIPEKAKRKVEELAREELIALIYHYNDVSYYYDMLNITTTFCGEGVW